MKEYTKIRQMYAWVGFITIAMLVIWGLVAIVGGERYIYIENRNSDAPEASQTPIPTPEPEKVIMGNVSAYSSSVDETDDTPFTTASNKKVRRGIVANNCLPFGTKVAIGGELFEVQDRMNARFDCNHFDIWMTSKSEALSWGRQIVEVSIHEN